jgi:hypothetical protein
MRASQNKCGHCGKSLDGLACFEKSIYRYCSLDCLKVADTHTGTADHILINDKGSLFLFLHFLPSNSKKLGVR